MPEQEHSVHQERMEALTCWHCGGDRFTAAKFTRPTYEDRICAVSLICAACGSEPAGAYIQVDAPVDADGTRIVALRIQRNRDADNDASRRKPFPPSMASTHLSVTVKTEEGLELSRCVGCGLYIWGSEEEDWTQEVASTSYAVGVLPVKAPATDLRRGETPPEPVRIVYPDGSIYGGAAGRCAWNGDWGKARGL